MKKVGRLIIFSLLAGCTPPRKIVVEGPSPGIDYHNQTTAPWPWVSVVPSERALAFKKVNFENLSRQIHFDMAFEPYNDTFKDVRIVLLDYTILPHEIKKGKQSSERPARYFMVASFYTIGRKPPCPPDFEVTATLRADKAGREEGMLYMLRDIIEEIYTLDNIGALTPGKKITVNLD